MTAHRTCGLDDRYPSGGCRPCAIARDKKWAATNRDRKNGHELKWRDRNPASAKLRDRKRNLKWYGLSVEQFDELLAQQGGMCALVAVCGSTTPGGKGQWHVDHFHFPDVEWKAMTDEEKRFSIRGLLCHNCNINRVGTNTVQSALAVVDYLTKQGRK